MFGIKFTGKSFSSKPIDKTLEQTINAMSVHFVSDKWVQPSIKDSERDERNQNRTPFQITEPLQQHPNNWRESLKNPSYKEALIQFLTSYWGSEDLADLAGIIGEKELYVNCGNNCYRYAVKDGKVERTEVECLYTEREEADERMFTHTGTVGGPSNIAVHTIDTNCLIIAIGSKSWLDESVHVGWK